MKKPLSPLAALLLAACSSTSAPPAGPIAPAPPPPPPPTGTVQPAEVAGHWTGDWGDLYLRTEADGTVRGVYNHDDGAVVGRVVDGVFTGWWCEAPSRRPDDDAGDVTFRFGRDASGGLTLDGRWRYGASTPDWREDWDLHWTQEPIDPSLVAWYDEGTRFCPHP